MKQAETVTSPFEKNLSKAKKYLAAQGFSSINNLRKDIKIIIPYLQRLFDSTKPDSVEAFEKIIIEDCRRYSKIVFESNFVSDNFMELLSCRYFQKHKEEFDAYLEKVRKPDFKLDSSDQSFEGCLTRYVYLLNNSFPEYLEDIKYSTFQDNTVCQIINNNKMSLQDRLKAVTDYVKKAYHNRTTHKRAIQNTKIILYGPREYLEEDEQDYIYDILDDSKKSILQIIEQSKKLGFYENYTQKQENQFRILGFPNYVSKNIDLTQTPHLLDSLSAEDLLVLNSFWINRYAKELNSYATAVFTLKDLNLLEDIFFKGISSYQEISDKTLENELIKYGFLNYPTTRFIKKREFQAENSNIDSIEGYENHEKFITYSYTPLIDSAKKLYGNEYTDYFNLVLPESQNNISEDIEFFVYLYNPILSSYSIKNLLLQSLSVEFVNFQNAGIVLENSKKNRLLLGIDAGLTFPIFEHLDSHSLQDFYLAYNGNLKIPIYDGYNDFISLTGDHLSTQLALPTSQKQVDILKQSCKKKNYPEHSRNTIQHLYFLKDNSRLPDSLVVPETKETKKRLRLPRRYLDLEDNKIYVKDENGAFIPIVPDSPTNLIKEEKEYGD